jgi:CubicO group peptidase (beta-lactamase class C family)
MTGRLMEGFPPRPETQVTLANWRTSPFNRWAFHHVREILPSADIAHNPTHVRELPVRTATFAGLRVNGAGGEALTLEQALKATSTDGLVVLHKGAIVLEHYANGMTLRSPHILMSVSKSMLGLLAGILVGRGALDVSRLVTDIVPEVRATAWAGATVGQLLDMRVGIAFAEDYLATSGPIVTYRKSTGWNPLQPGETASDLRAFFREMKDADGPHGGRFAYISPNTDLLGWVIERVAGERYADLMSELLWQPMGAADSAYITVDRLGAPRAAGGMCATTRDLARVGQLLVEGGAREGRQIIPAAWLDTIVRDGDAEAWAAGTLASYFPGVAMHYRAKWYVERSVPPLLLALGIHGQNLFVDTANAIVVAKFSSQSPPLDADLIGLTRRLACELRRAIAEAS